MASVFVSHRGADIQAAERLAAELRRCGHEVWLDIWNISVGDSIVGRINDGLNDSAYLLLCYSAEGTLAPWINREWMSALARQLNGEPVKLLPVRLTGGAPPSILADLKYADLTTNWTDGINELCAALA